MGKKVGATATILMVDDSPDTRALRKELLENDGYRVIAVADEPDAVSSLTHEHPDLILMSQHGPTLDAVATGCRIREGTKKGRDVPVVVLPTEPTEVRGVGMPLGHNVHVVYMSEFRQLEILLGSLLHKRRKKR